MQRVIKAIIFDMDGVLIDAKMWHYEALNRALNLYGFNIGLQEHLAIYDGLPTRKKLEILSKEKGLTQSLHEPINRLKQAYTLDLIESYCLPFDQHIQTLSHLRKAGYKLGLASNSVRKSVDVMMEKSKLKAYFDITLSNEDVLHPKPDPQIYLTAMQKLEVHPWETLVLEDNKNGIQAAKAAGAHLMKIESVQEVKYKSILNHLETCIQNIA